MTLEQLAEELKLKPSYLQKHWKQVSLRQREKGTRLAKIGRGQQANYGIKFEWDEKMRFTVE